MRLRLVLFFLLFSLVLSPGRGLAAERLRLATTTSTDNTGLLEVLLPPFETEKGLRVEVIAVGTGRALKLGQNGDVDVVLVHAPEREKAFVAQGHGINRRRVMHNYFVLVGPREDPAGLRGAGEVREALGRLARHKARFISRGDESGTHLKEKALWSAAGLRPDWPGYMEVGRGMGAVLIMADQEQAYTLTDTGTYYKYQAGGKVDLAEFPLRDELLKNPYSVIMVNPARHPAVKAEEARAFIEYLVSPRAQKIIRDFKAGGRQLFWPDALPAR